MTFNVPSARSHHTWDWSTRRGLTLIEVLIIITVIGILFALILPAVQSARESALRLQCASNLRQLGIALNSYHASANSLPHACNGNRAYSVHSMILPYAGELALYNSMNFSMPYIDGSNRTAARTVISSFLCPADPRSSNHTPATNYVCNIGYGYQIHKSYNGVFVNPPSQPTNLADVRDGTAYTAMMSEWVVGSGKNNEGDPLGSVFETPVELRRPDQFEQFVEQCAGMSLDKARHFWSLKGTEWVDGNLGSTSYNHNATVNTPTCFNGSYFMEGTWTASSRHSSGVNLLLADGHVRPVSKTIAQPVWRATGTRSGGEPIGLDD